MTEPYTEPTVATDQYPWLTMGQDEAIAYLKEQGRFPLSVNSGKKVNTLLVKSAGATLFFVSGLSARTTPQYIQVFDAIVAPAAGAVVNGPVIYVPAGPVNFSAAWGLVGRRFFAGIFLVNSTTDQTYTAGSADTIFDVQYV